MTKPKKVKTTTMVEEEIQPEDPAVEPDPPIVNIPVPESTQEEEDLKRFFSGLGSGEIIIKISKYDAATNRPRFLADTDVEGASESYIQSNWGEGKYLLRAYKEGNVIGSRTVLIGPPLNKPQLTPPTPLVAPGIDPFTLAQIESLREAQRSNQEMILRLIDKMGSTAQEKPAVQELAEVMVMLKQMQPPQESTSPMKVISEAIPLVKQLIDLGAAGGGSEKAGWLQTIRDVVPEVAGVFKSMAIAKVNGAPVAPNYPLKPEPDAPQLPQAITGLDPESLNKLQRYLLPFLKSRAEINADERVFIDFALNMLDDKQWQILTVLLNRPYEDIARIDPDLMLPVYRPWFERFFKGLSDALSERNDDAGIDGNPANLASDEAVGSKRRQE